MTIKTYNKLVRDKIPEIVRSSGKKATFKKETGDELLKLLNLKLDEELLEYKESGDIEELADLLEVVYGILKHKDISIEEFEKIRIEKNNKRGSFGEGLVLIEVIEE